MITVEIDDAQVKALLQKMQEEAENELAATLDTIGEQIRTTAILGIKDNSKKSGVVYKKKSQGGKSFYYHKASAKGEYPAADTGNLDLSIVKEVKDKKNVLVTAKANYAAKLENELQRPFLTRSVKENLNFIKEEVSKMVQRIINVSK